jgi:hypothetical protein
MAGLKSFGYLIVWRRHENAGGLRDDVEVVVRTVILVVLGTMQKFLIMHLAELYCLMG